MIAGRFFLNNWYIFLLLSLGWELLELVLPFEFAIETWDNKIGDIFVNCMAFYLGIMLRNKADSSEKTVRPDDN